MAKYKYNGKEYSFRAQLPNKNWLYANNEDTLRKAVEKKLGQKGKSWNWSSSDNGYSYSIKNISQNKPNSGPSRSQVRNMRRNNYNEQAKYYGFNSREEVRAMQKVLASMGYQLGRQGGSKDGIDGYMGNFTESAYLDAWQKNPEAMKAAGFKEPKSAGTGTVKVGNRTAMDTPQNRKMATKVTNADEHIAQNYGSDKMFNMFTLGATQLMSPTALYAYVRQIADEDTSFRDVAMNFLQGQNQGIFQNWDEVQQWVAQNPKAATLINMAADLAVGASAKLTPKVKTAAKSVGQNVKNAAVQSASAQTPRMRLSERVGGYQVQPAGNARILVAEMENVAARPGQLLMNGVRANGHIAGTNRGMAGQMNVTPTYDAAIYAPNNTVALVSSAPYGQTAKVVPQVRMEQPQAATVVTTPEGEFLVGGQAPYQTTWYNDPYAQMSDATQFKFGGIIRRLNSK